MVERQLRRRGIGDERVLAAMAEVPRELFVAERMRAPRLRRRGAADRRRADDLPALDRGRDLRGPGASRRRARARDRHRLGLLDRDPGAARARGDQRRAVRARWRATARERLARARDGQRRGPRRRRHPRRPRPRAVRRDRRPRDRAGAAARACSSSSSSAAGWWSRSPSRRADMLTVLTRTHRAARPGEPAPVQRGGSPPAASCPCSASRASSPSRACAPDRAR